MFQITHNKTLVYSQILVAHPTRKVIGEESIEDLMFLWANKTAIPYLKWIENFKTDNTIWYLKEEKEEEC